MSFHTVVVRLAPSAPPVELVVDANVDSMYESFGPGRGGRTTYGVAVDGYFHPRSGAELRLRRRYEDEIFPQIEQQLIAQDRNG